MKKQLAPAAIILALVLSVPISVLVVAEGSRFLIKKEAVKVWEWPQTSEVFPPGKPFNFFVVRYHKAPVGLEEFGPYGLSAYLSDVPELGVLLVAWNIKTKEDGSLNFDSATFAHRLESNWFVADPGFIVSAAPGFTKVDSVLVYVVYRRRMGSSPKIADREKVVAEYLFDFSTKTFVSVVFKIMDPDDQSREIYRFELDLKKTPVGEKVIEKEKRVR